MSMVSYAAGSRYLSLIGGVCMSFYDWYCDLPPASPQVWGEQTDVPESADWYNSTFIMAWGSNVPQTRTPDAHFFTEVRYKGAKTVAITPDYAEVAKLWRPVAASEAGHRRRAGDGDGARDPEGIPSRQAFGLFPRLRAPLHRPADAGEAGQARRPLRCRPLRARHATSPTSSAQANNADWKTVGVDETSGNVVTPNGSIGFRWGQTDGKWNLEAKNAASGTEVKLALSLIERRDDVVPVAFPYFGGIVNERFQHNDQGADVLLRNVPVKKLALADGECCVATVFDLMVANYGIDRGLGGGNVAKSFDEDVPYTPKWQEQITGVKAADVITVARQFADNADKTHGKSMVIIGAAMNHWYHCDMNYRGIINMLMMCGCVGKSGGGWAHYVGQEKLRPQTGWTALAFALDWHRPPRQMNSTSFFYAHTDQWRYEKLR